MAVNFYSVDLKLVASISETDLIDYVERKKYNVVMHRRATRFNLIWLQFKEIIQRFRLSDDVIAYMKLFNRNNNLVYVTVMFEGERIRITSKDLIQKISPDLKANDDFDPIEIVFSREPIPDTRTDKVYTEIINQNNGMNNNRLFNKQPMIISFVIIIVFLFAISIFYLMLKNNRINNF